MQAAMQSVRAEVCEGVKHIAQSAYDTLLNTTMSPSKGVTHNRSPYISMLEAREADEDMRDQGGEAGESRLTGSPSTYKLMAVGMGGMGVLMSSCCIHSISLGNYKMAVFEGLLAVFNYALAASDWRKSKIAASQD